MGHASKGGMYCEHCEKQVAAEKTTHGIRNTSAVFTYGMTGKLEQWQTRSRIKANQDTIREVANLPVKIVIRSLPNPDRSSSARG